MHPLILRLCCSIADPSGEDDEAAVEHRWISDVNCCRPNASIEDFLQNKFYQALDNGFGDSIDIYFGKLILADVKRYSKQ